MPKEETPSITHYFQNVTDPRKDNSISFYKFIYIKTHGQNRISSIDAQQEKYLFR